MLAMIVPCRWLCVLIVAAQLFGCAADRQRSHTNEPAILAQCDLAKNTMLVLVPVQYGGTKYRFALDTGTTGSVFDERFRGNLGAPVGKVEVQSLEKEAEADLYKATAALIGTLDVRRGGPVACTDLSAFSSALGQDVAGIIGMNVLGSYVVRIDMQTRCVWFLRADDKPHSDWGTAVSLAPNEHGIPTVMASICGRSPTPLAIDTGFFNTSHSGYLASSLLSQLVGVDKVMSRDGGMSMDAFGAVTSSRSVYGVDMCLSDTPYSGVSFGEDRWKSGLGMGFLSRYVVTLDFPNHRMYLKPQPHMDALPSQYQSGLLLRRKGQDLVVQAVAPRSPAAKADVQAGDVLLTINDQQTSCLQAWQASRLLMADHAKQVTLDVCRSGKTRQVTFVLVPPWRPPVPRRP